MALFGFASGLPFALFLGTLYAWLSEAEVDLETMGVFSLIGLAYAFQFLWSPLVDQGWTFPGCSQAFWANASSGSPRCNCCWASCW